ncbi:MAG: GNAT family N-acetyltransferase [Bacteroidota bacterium]
MKLQRLEEYLISPKQAASIQQLLSACFPDYPTGRTYYKQIPKFRYLYWQGNELIGHMAVEHRKMNIGGQLCTIFGVADLCVAEAHQSKKLASNLLSELEQLGKKIHIDFIVLIAQEHKLYENNGFQLVSNTCRWLMIHKEQTLGVGQRKIKECLMYKSLRGQAWPDGLIDFMGPIF